MMTCLPIGGMLKAFWLGDPGPLMRQMMFISSYNVRVILTSWQDPWLLVSSLGKLVRSPVVNGITTVKEIQVIQ